MDTSSDDIGAAVSLESVLCTEQLEQRPSRPPDFQTEIRALLVLLQELKNSPQTILQRLVDTALELCRGHSAGISLLEEGPPGHLSPKGDHFRWHAVAGDWAPMIWDTTTSRDNGPCGTVLDRNCALLFANAHRYYTQFAGVQPLLVEGLLVPFYVDGEAVGTVWVVAHDESRKFDAEDRRMLESLATFAATAYQVLENLIVLQQQAEALREADRRKTEFLAMLAHELRNPLAPIRNAVEILRQSSNGEQPVTPATEMMHRQVAQMGRLIDDLLDVARITRGRIELRRELIDLASVVRQAVETVRPMCESMAHELTVTLPPQPVYLHADPTRLAQVVGNLLTNACKFTERGGQIRLSAERESGREGRAIIQVQDTGIGIAPELLPSIFEMFTQVDTSLERVRDGLGIGLTLAKNLVEMHGGTVEARSPGLGRGSEFVVCLPVVSEPPKSRVQESLVLEQAATQPAQRRILVVDDNLDAADSLAMLLKLHGHEVHTAYDGLAALEMAAKVRPEVILLDLGLPKIDGYEAARRIREQLQDKKVTLVALSGWEEDRRRSEEAGFDRHMLKPVDFPVLTKLLAEPGAS